MSIGNLNMYDVEGRMRGHYVYMLLCDAEDAFYLKVGISISPLDRMKGIRHGCPFNPSILAFVKIGPKARALKIEAAMIEAFQPWHTRGEWFRLQPEDKPEFTARRQAVLKRFSADEPLRFEQIDAAAVLADGERKGRFVRMTFRRRGAAYRDFLAHQGNQ